MTIANIYIYIHIYIHTRDSDGGQFENISSKQNTVQRGKISSS